MDFDELEIVARAKGVDIATCLTEKPILLFAGLRYWSIEEGGVLVGDYEARESKTLTIFDDFMTLTNVAEHPNRQYLISFEAFRSIAKLLESGRAVSFYHVHPKNKPISLSDIDSLEIWSEAFLDLGVGEEAYKVLRRTPWFIVTDDFVVSFLDSPHIVVYGVGKLKWIVRSLPLKEADKELYNSLIADAELEGERLMKLVKNTHLTTTRKDVLVDLVKKKLKNDFKDKIRKILRRD